MINIKIGDTVVTHYGAGALLKVGLIGKVLNIKGESLSIQLDNNSVWHVQKKEVAKQCNCDWSTNGSEQTICDNNCLYH